MYICVFSRSDGDANATTRNTRGLTRSVIALIVPPFPAASRPSKITTTREPLCLTQSCNAQSSTCSLRSAFSYSLRFIGSLLGHELRTAPLSIGLPRRSSKIPPDATHGGGRDRPTKAFRD